MAKKCKNCGAVMPDEASTCLTCFTVQLESVATENKKIGIFAKLNAVNKKKATVIVAVALCALLILPISINAITNGFEPALSDEIQEQTTKKAVSSTTKTDGSIITEFDDGSVETQQTDGTVITEEKDGTKVTETPDGTTKTEKPDGTTITEKPDGTTQTEKPDGTVITEKPDGTTEVTQISTTTTTTTTTTIKPTTTTTTQPATTTTTVDNSSIQPNCSDFEYTVTTKGTAEITKYSGNDKIVAVPLKIDGYKVTVVSSNTFLDNNTVEKIIFKDPDDYNGSHSVIFSSSCITNCSNLKEIVFPKKVDVSNAIYFAKNCQSLENIVVYDNDWIFENGGLYCSISGTGPSVIGKRALHYYCEGYKKNNGEWHMPDWCTGTYHKFKYNQNVTKIYLNSTCNTSICSYLLSDYVEAIYVDDANTELYDIEGVLFKTQNNTLYMYPLAKVSSSFTIPDGSFVNFYSGARFYNNNNLTTLTIPKNVTFNEYELKWFCERNKKVSTINVETGNIHINYIQQHFDGEVIVY